MFAEQTDWRIHQGHRFCTNLKDFKILFRAENFIIRNITGSLIILRNRERWLMISLITIYSSARSSGHHQSWLTLNKYSQISVFLMKITASVTKRLWPRSWPVVSTLTYFFPINTLSSSAKKWKVVFIAVFLTKLDHRSPFNYICYETIWLANATHWV